MNNSAKRRRALGPMMVATMSAFEIEMLTSAGKKMVEEELETMRKEADKKSANKH